MLTLGVVLGYVLYVEAAQHAIQRGLDAAGAMAGMFGVGAILLAPVLAFEPLGWLASPRGAAMALHLGVVTIGVAYTLYGWGLRCLAVPTVVTLTLAEPLTAAILGTAVLGERLGPLGRLGNALIATGLLVTAREEVPADRSAERNVDAVGPQRPASSSTVSLPPHRWLTKRTPVPTYGSLALVPRNTPLAGRRSERQFRPTTALRWPLGTATLTKRTPLDRPHRFFGIHHCRWPTKRTPVPAHDSPTLAPRNRDAYEANPARPSAPLPRNTIADCLPCFFHSTLTPDIPPLESPFFTGTTCLAMPHRPPTDSPFPSRCSCYDPSTQLLGERGRSGSTATTPPFQPRGRWGTAQECRWVSSSNPVRRRCFNPVRNPVPLTGHDSDGRRTRKGHACRTGYALPAFATALVRVRPKGIKLRNRELDERLSPGNAKRPLQGP